VFKGVKQTARFDHVLGAVALFERFGMYSGDFAFSLRRTAGGAEWGRITRLLVTLWERYVENKLDYKSAAEVLKSKQRQAAMTVCVYSTGWNR